MKKLILILLLPVSLRAQLKPTDSVDPFIGTGGHGHTFPGPVVPFGMIQPGPDTRLSGWDGCSGYHYSDQKIYGFSHTHLSGTGASDYADILLMPGMNKAKWKNKQYAQSFSKTNEKAKAGYYSVLLDDSKIKVELTATARTGLHRYTPEQSGNMHVLLDLTHRDRVTESEIRFSGKSEISGKRFSSNWADNQQLYFVIQFSSPFKSHLLWQAGKVSDYEVSGKGNALKASVDFEVKAGEPIYARIGISAVSIENARYNLESEQKDFDFESVRRAAEDLWNKELNKIAAESKSPAILRTFYTALYHSMIAPNLYLDANNEYHGRDHKTHVAKGFDYYTVFSLWDTYRALHPLLTLIDQKRTADFVNTFVHQFREGGRLPVWELSSCETWCMIGYHAVPVIAEAILKGVEGFDKQAAFEAMKFSAMEDKNALDSYKKYGYVRDADGNQSVSRTLEYAYDDWCIAQTAIVLEKKEDYEYFIRRAANYKNLLDPSTGFMRPRTDNFHSPFDPYEVNHSYTEGNAWQYSFYVPHDISGHMNLLGGPDKLSGMLDSLFTTSSKLNGKKLPDITGLIGQYAHGNEPSHQIAYEYNYTAQPWKTQSMVRRIMDEMYKDEPDGLSGNEDCGQMSAWYIFSAMGFYPVCPGSDHYAIGSPVLDKATMQLESGKKFTVVALNNSPQNKYIQSALLNGVPVNRSYLLYSDIINGGILELNMGAEPNRNWGTGEGNVPVTTINN